MMRGFFTSVPVTNAVPASAVDKRHEIKEPECEIFTGYWSDISNVDDDDEVLPEGTGDDGHEGDDEQEDEVERLTNRMSPTAVNSVSMMPSHWPDVACQKFPIRAPPPLKRPGLRFQSGLFAKRHRRPERRSCGRPTMTSRSELNLLVPSLCVA